MSVSRRDVLRWLRGPLLGALAPLGLSTLGTATAQDNQLVRIGPGDIDLRNGGVPARAQWIRYKLVEVNGPTGGYVLDSRHGNPAGYLGAINQLTGPDFLGALLAPTGVDRCADIPTSGQLSGSVRARDGEVVEATAWFGGGSRFVPAHFDQA
jgi:hypothetical protein